MWQRPGTREELGVAAESVIGVRIAEAESQGVTVNFIMVPGRFAVPTSLATLALFGTCLMILADKELGDGKGDIQIMVKNCLLHQQLVMKGMDGFR